jgi:hypothetical protein
MQVLPRLFCLPAHQHASVTFDRQLIPGLWRVVLPQSHYASACLSSPGQV